MSLTVPPPPAPKDVTLKASQSWTRDELEQEHSAMEPIHGDHQMPMQPVTSDETGRFDFIWTIKKDGMSFGNNKDDKHKQQKEKAQWKQVNQQYKAHVDSATIQHAEIQHYHVQHNHPMGAMASLWANLVSIEGAIVILASAYGTSLIVRARGPRMPPFKPYWGPTAK